MKIAFLGHRIQDLGGFTENTLQKEIKGIIRSSLMAHSKPVIVLTSLAVGIEMWAGQAAYDLKIPFHVYLPFKDYHSKWPYTTRKEYSELLRHASKRVVLDDGAYDVKKLIAKDVAILEEADQVFSFYKDNTKLISKYEDKIVKALPTGDKDGWFITI